MAKKKPAASSIQRPIRFPLELLEQLEAEAGAADRRFADYVKHLLKTHPARPKYKQS